MKPSRILQRPPEQTVALPRIPSGVLRPLTPSSSDSRSLADRDGPGVKDGFTGNTKKQSYSDNFSEGSWEYYRNNFFASMIPPKRDYESFGLPTVEESPRLGERQDDDKVRRRSSSYSQALVLGPPPPPKKEISEVAILRLPVSSPQPRVRALSNYSILEEEELSKIKESVKEEIKEAEAEKIPIVSTSIYTIGNFDILDGEDLSPPGVAVDIPFERVIFPEEVETKKEPAPEPIKKYVPSCLKEKEVVPIQKASQPTEKAGQPTEKASPQILNLPPLTAIHYSDDAPVRPEENSLGEKRLVELEFVVGDYIQPLEGKLFYIPRQVVKMYCAPHVHMQDTDFMKEGNS